MISKERLSSIYYRAFPGRVGAGGLDAMFFFRGSQKEIDWGYIAHQNAEKHLEACYEALNAEEEGEAEIESPACAPFCGCDTCVVREVVYASWGAIANATRAGAVVEYDVHA